MMFQAHLQKHYSADFSLDLRLEFGEGIHVLFGSSGSGKSTVLRIIAGVTRADGGFARLGDAQLFDRDRKIELPAHLRRIALVFQDDALFPHLDALGNVAFGTRDWEAARGLLERFGLEHLTRRRPADMSGGERRRVALLRAWATDPRMLLLDEPMTGVDLPAQREIIAALKEFQQLRRIPILYVSHSPWECLQVGDTATIIQAGRKVAEGVPEDIFNHQQMNAADLDFN